MWVAESGSCVESLGPGESKGSLPLWKEAPPSGSAQHRRDHSAWRGAGLVDSCSVTLQYNVNRIYMKKDFFFSFINLSISTTENH